MERIYGKDGFLSRKRLGGIFALVFYPFFLHDEYMTFQELGVSGSIVQGLESQNIRIPTQVQEKILPLAFESKHLFVESETGTGKTLGFLIPMVQTISSSRGPIKGLIVSPTRELASQTHRVLERLCRDCASPLRSVLLLGGASPTRQLDEVAEKPEIAIGTPGRILQFLDAGKLNFSDLAYLVLDEADRLFAPEALEETEALLARIPSQTAMWLFSATLDPKTLAKARVFRPDSVEVRVDTKLVLSRDIEHWAFLYDLRRKTDAVRRFDVAVKPERALLFVRNSGDALNAFMRLSEAGIPVGAIHGDFDSQKRLEAVDDFRSGKTRWLITSDIASRGLDIEGISHVLMLDVPRDNSTYVHRAGRAGRNGKHGVCAVFADSGELKFLSRIALAFKFNFKTKRLHSESIYDVTLEEFFGEADKMASSFHSRRKPERP
jgi:ATP-dependent RNA helicase DeaD